MEPNEDDLSSSAAMEEEDVGQGIRLSDDPDERCRYLCGLCNKSVSFLRLHVTKKHRIAMKEYRKKYPVTKFAKKTHHRYRPIEHRKKGNIGTVSMV
jgi:hypothetical protein